MIFRVLILTALAINSFYFSIESFANEIKTLPSFCDTLKKNNDYASEFDKNILNEKSSIEAIESISYKYHEQIKKIYSDAIKKMESKNNDTSKTQCSNIETLQKEINRTILWNTTYQEFQKYDCTLQRIQNNPFFSGEEKTLLNGIETLSSIRKNAQKERIISKKLLYQAEELYGSYISFSPVHTQLLCLIGELQTYNKNLWNFIDGVVIIPSKFYNYGGTHQ